MNIAFYGRYSSDNQRDASIEDQRRVVARWAERNSHVIVAAYSDSAISGANIRLLTGLQDALGLVSARKASFEAIVVDQLSRLSRDVGDTDAAVKRLRFFGVRLIAVSDGLDTADESNKISVTVKSLVNELFLDDLRKTTKRGLDGQFLKNYSTGGRTYGYRSEPVYDSQARSDPRGVPIPVGYRLVVVPSEAAVVRKIFQLFGDGLGEKTIARQLNASETHKRWRANTIYLMLRNPRYLGRCVFNRREWRKNPETGKRVYRWRPSEQWESKQIEELRIVENEVWQKAQVRIATRPHLFSQRRTATIHLLSGLLYCDSCGGRFSIVARDYYGCRNHAESGSCSVGLRIHREAIEELVIDQLARHLPGWVEALQLAATRRVEGSADHSPADRSEQRTSLERRAATIMAAIEKGHLSERALREALGRYQQLWEQISILEATPPSVVRGAQSVEIRYDAAVLQDFIEHLPDALRADVSLGREFIHQTLKAIRIRSEGMRMRRCPICDEPFLKPTPQHMAAHGKALKRAYREFPELGFTQRARLLVEPSPEGLLNTGEVFGLMVAGAGFEPATFGL